MHEHNGMAERKHWHIVETGLTLLHQASLPPTYWTYSFATAMYLINRLPSPIIDNNSPYQKLFQKQPNYLKLRVFVCLCFPWLRPYTQHKLDHRSFPCIFLGYSIMQSAYLCLHLATGRIYTSRHVQYVETAFPYTPPKNQPSTEEDVSTPYTPPIHVPVSQPPLIHALPQPPPSQDPHHLHQAMPSSAHSVSQE